MKNSLSDKELLAQAILLKYVPPLIRESLLEDQDFLREFVLTKNVIVSLGTKNSDFNRSELFNAVRYVLADAGETDVSDVNGCLWTLRNEATEDALPKLVLSSTDQRLIISHFTLLSEDPSKRIRVLEQAVFNTNLPHCATEKWRKILVDRPLTDDEIDIFQRDICNTPVHLMQSLPTKFIKGECRISFLVPNSRQYFERLIGIYDGSKSIVPYADEISLNLFKQLTSWKSYEGFLFCLLLSAHSALTAKINVDNLSEEKFVKAFDFVEKHGDMLSRLGAFEVGLRVLPERPEVEPFLLRLVHRICDDDVEGDYSEFKLFSALFILVDGELARIHLLAEKPPFYRRLASLTQAALIHRQLNKFQIDYNKISEWAISQRGEYYYMQSLSDMRSEPSWNPDLAVAAQIKAEFVSRIITASNCFKENIKSGELHDMVFKDGQQNIFNLCEFKCLFFPGPLEGNEKNQNILQDEQASFIKEQLNADKIEAASFVPLVNSALIFNITSDYAELASKAIKKGNYSFSNLQNKSQLVSVLNGLSTVAAISRTPTLANDLRILTRRYRQNSQYGLSIQEVIKICLMASASREDLMEWREFVGEWLTELAFNELEGDEGEYFYSHLTVLLHLIPELWRSCARADAALQAWCAL